MTASEKVNGTLTPSSEQLVCTQCGVNVWVAMVPGTDTTLIYFAPQTFEQHFVWVLPGHVGMCILMKTDFREYKCFVKLVYHSYNDHLNSRRTRTEQFCDF